MIVILVLGLGVGAAAQIVHLRVRNEDLRQRLHVVEEAYRTAIHTIACQATVIQRLEDDYGQRSYEEF